MIPAKEHIDQMDVLRSQANQAGKMKAAWKAQGKYLKASETKLKKATKAIKQVIARADQELANIDPSDQAAQAQIRLLEDFRMDAQEGLP